MTLAGTLDLRMEKILTLDSAEVKKKFKKAKSSAPSACCLPAS